MALEIEPGLADAIAASTGAVHLEVRGSTDPGAVQRGLTRARELLYQIPHPEEPDDPLPSVATVKERPEGPSLWFDIADAEAYPGLTEKVIASVVEGVSREGVDGTLAIVRGGGRVVATEQAAVTPLTAEELAVMAGVFADRFMAATGVDAGWRDDVIEQFRIRPGTKSIRLIFRGAEVRYPWDGTPRGAEAIASACVDELAAHWRAQFEEQVDRWAAPPGQHRTLGCLCEDRERREGKAAGEYLSHLKQMGVEGTEAAGRAGFVCTLIGQRWVYTWSDGSYVLEPYGEPHPKARLSGA